MKFGKWAGLRILALLVLGSLLLLVACSSSTSSSSSTSATALFVTTQGDSLISAFSVASDGRPTANGAGLATGATATSMVLAPSGNAIFVVNHTDKTISAFTVNSDGTLAAAGTQDVRSDPLRIDVDPVGLAIDPAGAFLFVVNQGDIDLSASDAIFGSVSVFSVSGTTLTELPASPFITEACIPPGCTAGNGPIAAAVAVVQSGSYLYTANQFDGTVSAFTIDALGNLTPVPGAASYPAGTAPSAVVASVDGNFLYVANAGSNNISGFTICGVVSVTCSVADGSLLPFADPVSAGTSPVSLAVAPSGNFLYAVDFGSNQVSQYQISTVTGILTPDSPAAISTGSNPTWIAIPATGQFAYVANIGAATISTFRIAVTTGNLSKDGAPVPTGGQPSAIVVK